MEYQYFWVAILITHIQIPLDPGGGGMKLKQIQFLMRL